MPNCLNTFTVGVTCDLDRIEMNWNNNQNIVIEHNLKVDSTDFFFFNLKKSTGMKKNLRWRSTIKSIMKNSEI